MTGNADLITTQAKQAFSIATHKQLAELLQTLNDTDQKRLVFEFLEPQKKEILSILISPDESNASSVQYFLQVLNDNQVFLRESTLFEDFIGKHQAAIDTDESLSQSVGNLKQGLTPPSGMQGIEDLGSNLVFLLVGDKRIPAMEEKIRLCPIFRSRLDHRWADRPAADLKEFRMYTGDENLFEEMIAALNTGKLDMGLVETEKMLLFASAYCATEW